MTEQEEAERRRLWHVAWGWLVSREACPEPDVDTLRDLIASERADARRQALEEAADIAEERPSDPRPFVMHGPRAIIVYLAEVAERIRALASPKP